MRKALAAVLALGLILVSGAAFAETRTWGGQDWEYGHEGSGSVTQTGDVFNFVCAGSAPGGAWYVAQTPAVDFTTDFQYAVRFHNAVGQDPVHGLDFGLMRFTGAPAPILAAYASFSRNSDGGNFEAMVDDATNGGTTYWSSGGFYTLNTDGWMGFRYLKATDTLGFGLFDQNGNMIDQAGGDVLNFTFTHGSSPMKLYASGWSGGTALIAGDSTLTNFGTATPEPVSSALFLLGGAVLAARKMRKKA